MHTSTQWVPYVWDRLTLPQLYNAPEYSSDFAPFEARFAKVSYSGHKNVPSCGPIFASIILILKSLVIRAIWLAHSSVTYSRIFLSGLNHIIHVLNRIILALYYIISILNTKWDMKAFLFSLFNKLVTRSIKYWYLLNSAISKWLQWSGKWTFGLKSYLCFQIKFGFKITHIISDQIALHSVQ